MQEVVHTWIKVKTTTHLIPLQSFSEVYHLKPICQEFKSLQCLQRCFGVDPKKGSKKILQEQPCVKQFFAEITQTPRKMVANGSCRFQ